MSGEACACGTCASCSGVAPRPAVADPLVYRHGAVKERMLGRIAGLELDGERPLARLTTRDEDDPAIALIDAFAGSLHILAYSAARLSDDGSILRTQDRDALARLTRMLGYEPRPALSASTTLSFEVNALVGAPTRATIPAGTKIASVPGQDETPQVFETEAELDARAEWNALEPVLAKVSPPVSAATAAITLDGVANAVKAGDLLLVYLNPQAGGKNWLSARVASVERVTDDGPPRTLVGLSGQAALSSVAALTGPPFHNRVIVLAQRAAAFGSTAPDLAMLPKEVSDPLDDGNTPPEWANLKMNVAPAGQTPRLDLDAIYPDAMPGRFVLFSAESKTEIGRIAQVVERSRVGFGLAAKVSRVTPEGIDLSDAGFNKLVRGTSIFIETSDEQLLLSDEESAYPPAPHDRLTVAGKVELPPGRRVVLTGEKWNDPDGATLSEVATIKSATPGPASTLLVFERAVAGRFRSTSLVLLGNSIGASHGETPVSGAELVGSSDAAHRLPRYALKAAPLSHVPAANPRGYAAAVEVRVAGRLYDERPTLHGLDSEDRAFTVRTVEDGRSELQFAGRLPSGVNNVTALYRVGSGTGGNLEADRLSTMLSPVLGVMRARNAVPAEGGSDAETLEDMRASAPQSIRTLDRVVSLSDFEVFARRFRGVGKALATELRAGMRSIVCLTIATTDLTSPTVGSDIVQTLRAALAQVSVPGRLVRIEGFVDLDAHVTIGLASDPALIRANVEAAVRGALGARFGRSARGFAEALHESAILAAVQAVPGVVAARIQALAIPGGPAAADGRLLSPAPSLAGGLFQPAGLLAIDPAAVLFTEMLP